MGDMAPAQSVDGSRWRRMYEKRTPSCRKGRFHTTLFDEIDCHKRSSIRDNELHRRRSRVEKLAMVDKVKIWTNPRIWAKIWMAIWLVTTFCCWLTYEYSKVLSCRDSRMRSMVIVVERIIPGKTISFESKDASWSTCVRKSSD
jgi:hypothetical protein